MSEFGNPFEGTLPPPLNGPEPAKRKGRPKGSVNKVKSAKARTPKPGRRTHPLGSVSADRRAAKAVMGGDSGDIMPTPSFAGSDNIAALLSTLDPPDVQLFFDMYRAIQPREPGDRRTIVNALQAALA